MEASKMNPKLEALLGILLLVTAYAFGRWSAPEKIKEVTKTVEVEKKTDTKSSDTDRDTHKKTTVTEVTAPDGTKTKTTEVVEDTSVNRKSTDTSTDALNKSTVTDKEITRSSSKVSVLGLYGISMAGGAPDYGISVSRPLLGPITAGVFYLSPGILGGSIGLTF